MHHDSHHLLSMIIFVTYPFLMFLIQKRFETIGFFKIRNPKASHGPCQCTHHPSRFDQSELPCWWVKSSSSCAPRRRVATQPKGNKIGHARGSLAWKICEDKIVFEWFLDKEATLCQHSYHAIGLANHSLQKHQKKHYLHDILTCYCWWNNSCTTWDV